ncbi:hypothetical protein LC574_17740 [Nostoc sp. CHAB 5715]|nr:hypothetical protein [Nostoc sp. CHAB 5715]
MNWTQGKGGAEEMREMRGMRRMRGTRENLLPSLPYPMTAVAPLGETPRPHCLPHAQCPMPNSQV